MVLLHSSFVTPCVVWCPHHWSHNPTSATPPGLALTWFGLYPLRSPLLGVSRLLSFPDGTEMFQFPSFPPPALCIQAGVTLHDECRVSPFGHLRIEAQSTAPRSFSQSLTSFIGSWRQGIHRWLFVAWNSLRSFFRTSSFSPETSSVENKMLVLALQFSRCDVTHAERSWALDAAASKASRSTRVVDPAPSKRKRRR